MNVQDDPANLFALESTSSNAPTPPLTHSASPLSNVPPSSEDAKLYVEIPKLSTETLEKYEPSNIPGSEVYLRTKRPPKALYVKAELNWEEKAWVYVKYDDGFCRRFSQSVLRETLPEMAKDYDERLSSGKIKEITSPDYFVVHPEHAEDVDSIYFTYDESEDDEDQESFYNTIANRSRWKGTSKRISRMSSSRHRFSSVETDDESDYQLRRSSRAVTKKSYALHEDSDFEAGDSSSEGSSGYDSGSVLSGSSKPKRRRKAPKPAYGCIHSIHDDYDSDEETAALRKHYDICEKCHRSPSHILLERAKRSKRKRKRDEDELDPNNEEYLTRLGGWVQCLKCCTVSHWRCLSATQRSEIVKAVRAKAQTEDNLMGQGLGGFKDLEIDEATDFVCASCSKGGMCMVCHEVVLKPEPKDELATPNDLPNSVTDDKMEVDGEPAKTLDHDSPTSRESDSSLLFRCFRCRRLAHYHHLKKPDDNQDLTVAEVAEYYQNENKWECNDCISYVLPVDKVIAWRPYPADAKDAYMDPLAMPKYKENLPREYLVKWKTRSYRRTTWVPHMWLLSTNMARLKNFYELGPRIPLSDNSGDDGAERIVTDEPTMLEGSSRETSVEATLINSDGTPAPLPDAEARIPKLWTTVERVLDVRIWTPTKRLNKSREGYSGENGETDEAPLEAQEEFDRAFKFGEEPSGNFDVDVDEFEKRSGRKLQESDADKIIWAFIKWDDLNYDEATWDSPPRPGERGYQKYLHAFKSFLSSRTVTVKQKSASFYKLLDDREGIYKDPLKLKISSDGKYDIGQDEQSKLMPFQIQGVSWLSYNWIKKTSSILADEMGLGKTVQIITFLGLLHSRLDIYPFLVVVPNSTISNWVREFARWAPNLRVVPFYGDAESRRIIKQYELHHDRVTHGTTGAKYHVLVTTYETVTGKNDFSPVFKKNPRWEVLVVDEGQRLKSDTNLIFRRLSELNSGFRVLMTGTPLNNNIRELFNLLNFLDPEEWSDLDTLESEYEVLDEERVKTLHEKLRPYFLRRVKADVLSLPPKNEVIVPVSMAPLQKEVYKSIISKNLNLLRMLTVDSSTRVNKSYTKKSNMRNILMELRKCTQHPYLVHDEIEPKDLSIEDSHSKLIDASSKLRFLKLLLPKLKAKGHRILLFSQFKLALNIIEDFLQGEGHKFLRLDGDTKQADRQKSVDAFNHENSDYFVFILTTRAGGVGINLWSADTVILFDPDFNPHQDLQAIARAHRYGQKKRCLVFKFMTKDSVEEKIMQTGKKKLVLDHLIVQKIDEDDTEDLRSLLTFGAKALFEEGEGNHDINYSENDIDDLINKVETEAVQDESSDALSFAKVWSANKETLDDLIDADNANETEDSWAQTLKKIEEQRKQEEVRQREKIGRGVRRKTTKVKNYYIDDSPERVSKSKKKKDQHYDSEDEYARPPSVTSEATTDAEVLPEENLGLNDAEPFKPSDNQATIPNVTQFRLDLNNEWNQVGYPKPGVFLIDPRSSQAPSITSNPLPSNSFSAPTLTTPLQTTQSIHELGLCSLCSNVHGPGQCRMIDNAHNLVEYRRVIVDSFDLPLEERNFAISLIDERLEKRGLSHLTKHQPRKARTLDLPVLQNPRSVTTTTTTSSGPGPALLGQTIQTQDMGYGQHPAKKMKTV